MKLEVGKALADRSPSISWPGSAIILKQFKMLRFNLLLLANTKQ
jgi:hypothetical protein